jgi:hypothetical protein
MTSFPIKELIEILETVPTQLRSIPDDDFNYKPAPSKWSKKEIVGHLVDSALNNHQRIIRAQYEDTPLVTYNQDKWVQLNDWQNYSQEKLIDLWEIINRHLLVAIKNIPNEALSRLVNVGNATYTIEYVISDYVEHLKHHLAQLIILKIKSESD